MVWDLDSTLPFPLALDQYIHKAIRPLSFDNSIYRRYNQLLNAGCFWSSMYGFYHWYTFCHTVMYGRDISGLFF